LGVLCVLCGKKFLVLAWHVALFPSEFPAGKSIFLILGEVRPFLS
jgi:hypothetical protein